MSNITELKKLLIDQLTLALETLSPADKGFSGVATAALAAVKTFHDEVEGDTAQASSHLSAALVRYNTKAKPTTQAN